MGNSPTHRACEGDDAAGDDAHAGRSLPRRAVGAIVSSVRNFVAVFSELDLGTASHEGHERLGTSESSSGKPTDLAVPRERNETTAVVPARERGPTRTESAREDAPDLEATMEAGRLRVSYPGEPDAGISSDTYVPIER